MTLSRAVSVLMLLCCVSSTLQAKPRQKKAPARQHSSLKSHPQKRGHEVSSANQVIAARQHELASLQKSIESDRKRIASLGAKESSTVQAIAQYRKHSQNIRRFMQLLEDEIESLQDKAQTAHTQSELTASDLWRLRQRYATVVQTAMSNDRGDKDPLLMASTTSSDPTLDAEVLQRVTREARQTFRQLADRRDSLSDASQKLRTRSEMRAALLNLKESEQAELDRTIAATQKALEHIRSDKTQVAAHLKKSQSSAAEISRMISSMVNRDAKSKTTADKKLGSKSAPATKGNATVATASLKGMSLRFPVSSRRVLHGFGAYRNSITNTVTDNPGVDIAVAQGTNVSSIASGRVSLVHWLPGYGSVVIVDHGNGVRSVYANLSTVNVKVGQSLGAQQSVGKSGESIDGEFVHIELWHDKQRVNPMAYLK